MHTGPVEGSHHPLQDTLGHSLLQDTSLHSISLHTSLTVAVYHACYVTAWVHLALCYILIMYECSTNRRCCLALYDCATVCTWVSTTAHSPVSTNSTSPADSQHYWRPVLTHLQNQPHCYMYTCQCHTDDTGL